ncbi:MAG: response regulator, partial [Alphaproteobacteria bacterium]
MSLRLNHVLLVDDNEDDYLIVSDLLSDVTEAGMEIEWASTYDEAYDALSHKQYDVCLLDYRLGLHTGLDLLRDLTHGYTTPVILLTGMEDYEVDVAAARAGASDYLVKSHINAPLLERSIRYAMQRKESEEALLQAQLFAQSTVDALPDNIAVVNEYGIIVAVNAAWRAFADVNSLVGAVVGDNYLRVCHASNSKEAHRIAGGIRAVMSGEKDLFFTEYDCHSANDQQWYEMRATRFSGGGPIHVVIAHENITARKQAEVQLLESEADLARAQQIARLGSWELDLVPTENVYHNRVRGSAEVSRIFGFQPLQTDLTLKDFLRVVPSEEHESINSAMSQALQQGKPYRLDHRIMLPDGAERIVHEQAEVVFDERTGTPLKMVGTVQDITERKQAELSLKKSQQRLALATESAHMG